MMNKKTSRLYTLFLRFLYDFAFTKSDRRAIGVLLVLIALTVFLRAYGLVRPAKEWWVKPEMQAIQTNPPARNGEQSTRQAYTPPAYMVKKPFLIDLNTADTLDLQELRGIGPSYARKIVRYRERLGGFVQVEQLREVWGIDSLLLEKIKPSVYVKNTSLRKIPLNEVDLRTLKQHPYLDYYQAKEIYLHRQKYGAFSSLEDLLKVNLMDSGTFQRLLPYVYLEPSMPDSTNPRTQTSESKSK